MKPVDLYEACSYCDAVAHDVEHAEGDALDALADMRALVKSATEAIAKIEPYAMNAAEKYHEKTFVHNGMTFQRTDGKRAFKYDHLKEWADAKRALSTIEERAKNAALQAEKRLVVAGEDGLVDEPAIITYGKPSISIVKQ